MSDKLGHCWKYISMREMYHFPILLLCHDPLHPHVHGGNGFACAGPMGFLRHIRKSQTKVFRSL